MNLFRWLIPIAMGVTLIAPVSHAIAQPAPRETLEYTINADAGIGKVSVKKTLSGRVIKEKGNLSKILDYTSYTPLIHFIVPIVDSTYVRMECKEEGIYCESHRYKYVNGKLEEYFSANKTFPYEERGSLAYYLLARLVSMRTVGELDKIERDYLDIFSGGQVLHAVVINPQFEIKRENQRRDNQDFITLVVSSKGLNLNNVCLTYKINGDSLIPCGGSGKRGIFRVRTQMNYK